jgi:hypothetical protein
MGRMGTSFTLKSTLKAVMRLSTSRVAREAVKLQRGRVCEQEVNFPPRMR